MNMKQKKLSPFWCIYIGIVSVLVILLITGAGILISYLSAFENSQPIHPAESAFSYYFEEGNFEAALKAAKFKTSKAEDLSVVAKALKDQSRGKKFALCAIGTEDGLATYNVVLTDPKYVKDKQTGPSGDTKIATMRFAKSKEKGEWGFSPYQFSDIKFFFKGQVNITCAIPENYTLLVNSGKMGEDMVSEKEAHEWNAYLPEKTPGITLNVFQLTDLFREPTLLCKDGEGNPVDLTLNEKTGRYEAGITYEKEVDQALKDRIMMGMKEYAKYIQDDGSLGVVASYFDRTSMFYKNTAGNPSVFVWDHNGFEFKNEVIEDFYFFDDNTLCCHVVFDQVLKKTGREDYIDHLDMTIFVKKQGNTWRIFDRIVR